MLYIKNRIITDLDLSNNGYLAYLGVTMLLRRNENYYFANTNLLAYMLSKCYPAENNLKKNILNGMNELAEKKMIIFEQISDSRQEWIINVETLLHDGEINDDCKLNPNNFYTAIDEDEIRKILSSGNRYYNKVISIIRFYSYLLSTIHNKDDGYKGAGFTTISEMSKTMQCNEKTVSQYLTFLSDLKLIYIFKSNDFIKLNTGGIIEISHTYGRYRDKSLINKIGKQHVKTYGDKLNAAHTRVKRKNQDKTRKYSQMYNYIYKCTKDKKEIPYSYSEIKAVYLAMCELNDKYKHERKSRVKDLSIFKNYNFYKKGF